MTEDIDQECRFFVSYSGVKLPFNLVNPIPAEGFRTEIPSFAPISIKRTR